MPSRSTIRDVARRAGVHPATASRALNPDLPGRVTPQTTRRVQSAARELGYHPDPIARSLRTRRSGAVGVVVPDLTNPVVAPIVRGIEKVLWTAGVVCLLADTDNDAEREVALVGELRKRYCDGLIVLTAARTSATATSLAQGDLPTVLVTRDIDSGSLPFVGADDAAGVRKAVAHLVDLGHRRIAHLTGPAHLSTTVTRLSAFQEALRHHALDPEVSHISHGDSFTVSTGRALTADLLARRPDITAIVAGNDMIALGCYHALTDSGSRCPDDVSVVGHNDMPMVDSLQPPLTTVAIPQYEIGQRAASRLLELLSGTAVSQAHDLLPTRLVIRGSTSRPDVANRADDPATS